MSIRVFPFMAVVAMVAATVPASWAATFVPTRFDDPAPNGCQRSDCSLREAVIAANTHPGPDQILLAAGTYVLSRPASPSGDALGEDLDVLDALEIVGAGSTSTLVVAKFAATTKDTRVIEAPGVDLVLRGVHLQGGAVSYVLQLADGGCLVARYSKLMLEDVAVSACRADLGGGVGLRGGSAIFNDVRIVGNVARQGGGLVLTGAASTAGLRVVVANNTAFLEGGGIHVWHVGTMSDLNWRVDSSITGNKAERGGGIHVAGGSRLRLEPKADDAADDELLRISDNVASAGGGGVAVDGTLIAALLAVHDNTVIGTLDGGGALVTGSATITDTEFATNVAPRDGGGIAITASGKARIERVGFVGNVAGRYGGGIASVGYAEIVNLSSFANTAQSGGALDTSGATRILHFSALDDSVPALRVSGTTQFQNGVVSGGCLFLGPGFQPGASGAEASGYASCGLQAHAPSKLALSYGYYGGRFAVVGIGDPGSVLVDAAPLLAQALLDVRGWTRTGSADIGAYEVGASPP